MKGFLFLHPKAACKTAACPGKSERQQNNQMAELIARLFPPLMPNRILATNPTKSSRKHHGEINQLLA